MTQILFFDSDSILEDLIASQPIPNSEIIFFPESLNVISKAEIRPYLSAEVISCFTHSEMLDNKKLDLFPQLKLIATRSTGFNHIDLNYCRKRKIAVVNVPAYGASTVAEFAFGLLIALSRKMIRAKNDMAQNMIDNRYYMGFDLSGKTIGIIGTGSIGRHMIQIAKGFDMKIIAYDPYPNPKLKDFYVKNLEDIYAQSDIISLHIPSTKKNRHLIDKKAFQKMKKGVILINTARGDLIDTQALYEALKNGIVGGAGLDVLENEDFLLHDDIALTPHAQNTDFLLDSAMNLKLLQFKNVIVTPHIAFNSIDAINRINIITVQNITAFLGGKTMNNVY